MNLNNTGIQLWIQFSGNYVYLFLSKFPWKEQTGESKGPYIIFCSYIINNNNNNILRGSKGRTLTSSRRPFTLTSEKENSGNCRKTLEFSSVYSVIQFQSFPFLLPQSFFQRQNTWNLGSEGKNFLPRSPSFFQRESEIWYEPRIALRMDLFIKSKLN